MNKKAGITVLSLCDGMSCGRIALSELNVKINRYYASEIDRFAIKQTQLNFPDTIQLGDIEGWENWYIDWAGIDLILAGTPCTGFSTAGKRLNFDDPQSRLFWVFVDILNHIKSVNPNVLFLLENVKMRKEYLRIISKALGVHPVLINSALVSAQNRKRYYWSNIKTKKCGLFGELHTDIPQPEDRKILLRDILENEVNRKYYITGDRLKKVLKFYPRIMPEKSYCLVKDMTPTKQKRIITTLVIDTNGRINKNQEKASCLTGSGGHGAGNHSDMDLILQRERGFNKGGIHEDKCPTLSSHAFEQNNFLITPNGGQTDVISDGLIRRLTPVECARLQTVPEWYKWECSDTQIYKLLGNGWTIEIIKHILKSK